MTALTAETIRMVAVEAQLAEMELSKGTPLICDCVGCC